MALFGLIFFIEPGLARVPNDPQYADQSDVWDQVNAPEAWDYTVGSKRIVVAMIDTGMDTWHEDLRDNLWVNSEEIPGNGIDDDHNGYVDDINGWNFVENNNDVRTSVFDTADDKEAVRHGTLLGGIIGARGDNGLDGVGVNWRISLMPLRAIRSDGKGSFRAVTEAVNYAVDNGADVISLSFMGDTAETSLLEALRRAYDKGIVIVTAAGNYDSPDSSNGNLNKKPLYPACFDHEGDSSDNWIITVGSVDKFDVLSQFSNYGKCVDIMAPGEYIYNTERYAPQFGYPNEFGGPWFGTSFATPLVAGTAALIKSIHPEWSAKKIISTIFSTADPIDSKNFVHAGDLGKGRINIGRAVVAAVATPLKNLKGGIYYIENGSLKKYAFASGQKIRLAGLPAGRFIAAESHQMYDGERVSVLLRRGNRYFLEIYKDDGQFMREKNISARLIPKKGAGIDFTFPDKFNIVDADFIIKKKRAVLNKLKLDPKVWSVKFIPMSNRVYYLPFKHGGGSFVAYDQNFQPAVTIKLPTLPKVTF